MENDHARSQGAPLGDDDCRDILESLPDIVYACDAAGIVTYLSPQAARLGVDPERIVGSSILDLIHPDDLEQVARDFGEANATGRELPSRFRAVTPNGRVVHFEERGKIRYEAGEVAGAVGTLRDVTEMEQAEERRERLNRALRGIIPICMYCKKIRDDKGGWSQIERFLSEHSAAEFSHGMCPECYEKHHGSDDLEK